MKKITTNIILLALLLIIPIKASAASLLSKLEVEGIGELSLSKTSWNLQLTTSLDYANIIAVPTEETVIIEGDGKVSVQEGQNQIIVKASKEEQVETYTINLNVIKSSVSTNASDPKIVDDSGTDVKNPDTGSFISYTIMAILAGSLLVIILKNKKKIFNIR